MLLLFSQQKLVLRNNSTSATQQLRLLIRGQDQDCFQVDQKLKNVSSCPFVLACCCFIIIFYIIFCEYNADIVISIR